MSILEDAQKKVNAIQGELKEKYKEIDKSIAEVKDNRDFTELARNKKIESLERERSKIYSDIVKRKQAIIGEADDKLRSRLYSGKNSSDLAFDEAAIRFSRAETDKELVDVLKSKPSGETLRAVLKGSILSSTPRWPVLEYAANNHPDVKDKIVELADLHREWGSLEPEQQKAERKLFGDHASV